MQAVTATIASGLLLVAIVCNSSKPTQVAAADSLELSLSTLTHSALFVIVRWPFSVVGAINVCALARDIREREREREQTATD